jgi:hypothetical protein
MISIDITYRTDICPGEIRSAADFLDHVGREHPVLVELVNSGEIDDTNIYRSHMYEARRHYSADGWFIIGDAGDTVDPLYSHGLAPISIQARQIAEAMRKSARGEAMDRFVADLDTAYTNIHRSGTYEITSLYEDMRDGFRCHLRMHLVILALFCLMMPLIFCGYVWDLRGVQIFNGLVVRRRTLTDLARWRRLIDARAGTAHDDFSGGNFVKVQSPFSLNYSFFQDPKEEDIPRSISSMLFYLTGLRLRFLLQSGWRAALAGEQHAALLRDLARAMAMHFLFEGG